MPDDIEGLVPLTPDTFRTIDLEHFTLGPTGLVVKLREGQPPPLEAWEAVGQVLRTLERGVAWLVGDWCAYGEMAYGDRALQAIGDFAPETARVYSWVAAKIPPESRDHRVSFSHHQVVAALPPAEQRAWLDLAAAGSDGAPWTSKRLKHEVAARAQPSTRIEYMLQVAFLQPSDRDAVAAEHTRAGRDVRTFERTREAEK